jgi:putative redox protein
VLVYDVEVRNVHGQVTAVGAAGPYTLVVDRPVAGGGGGLGFNGGELLHLAVAGCVSNDLFREAASRGIALSRVLVRASGDFAGDPAVSTGVTYSVEVEGDADDDALSELVRHVDRIAEIPGSLRGGTAVTLVGAAVRGTVG